MMIKRVIEIEEDTLKRIDEAESVPDMFGTDIVNGLNAIKYSKPYTEPLGDLICRSDALKAVDNRHEELLHDAEYRRKHCDIDLLGIKKHILAIPPVEAIVDTTEVRPKGEWIIVDDCEQFIAKCSVCGRVEDSRKVKDYPFCHCGAAMRTEDK